MLEDLLLERQLEITNLRFQKRKGKLWTYLSDMNQIKSQIDFIICRKKWRNSIKNSEAYGSFHSMGSDHRVVIARIKLSLRMSKTKRRNPAPDWDKLKTDIDPQERYAVEVKNRFALLEREGETATERYQHLIDANETASKLLPTKERKKRSKISEDARVEAARLELRESSNLYHIQATEENRVSVQEAKQNLSDAYKAAQEQLLESQIKELEEASNEGRHPKRWSTINKITAKAPSYTVATGDLDLDGDVDIVIGNSRQKNVIYFNEAQGIKFRSVDFGQIAGTYSVEVGDLNGDKFPDIVVGNSGAHNFIYFNQGKQGKAGEVLPGKRIALNH